MLKKLKSTGSIVQTLEGCLIEYVYTYFCVDIPKISSKCTKLQDERFRLRAGMNSGVLLLRNTDWNRDLFAQMAAYGTTPMNVTKEAVRLLHENDRCFCFAMEPCWF